MTKVLSTKLTVDQVDQFAAIAEQQGETKSRLLKRLVLDYVNKGNQVSRAEAIGRPQSTASSTEESPFEKTEHSNDISSCTSTSPGDHSTSEGLHSRAPIYLHHSSTCCPTPASPAEDLPSTTKTEYHVDSPPSSGESLPVYSNESKGRPKASAISSTVKGLLLVLFLLALRLKYGPSIDVGRKSLSST